MKVTVVLEIELKHRVSGDELKKHVADAVGHWGGSQEPESPFFPDNITVTAIGSSRMKKPQD